jgi:hypothetical protein
VHASLNLPAWVFYVASLWERENGPYGTAARFGLGGVVATIEATSEVIFSWSSPRTLTGQKLDGHCQIEEGAVASNHLRIYLNDHLAGASAGEALAKRCLSNNQGTPLVTI